jgi:hypothetical protein
MTQTEHLPDAANDGLASAGHFCRRDGRFEKFLRRDAFAPSQQSCRFRNSQSSQSVCAARHDDVVIGKICRFDLARRDRSG